MTATVRILYAEDNPQDADQTRAHLAEHAPEFVVEIANTGQACLERLRSEEFDLLLLDYRLPDMDGLEVLKKLLDSGLQLPVVLVTGVGDDDLVVKALRMGAAGYVPKVGNYLQTLHELLRHVLAEQRRKQSQGQLPFTPRRILYVEHHPMDIELTLRHFAEHAPHFLVEVVNSCAQALARLAQAHSYDLALIDLRMPDQSGLDLVHEARCRHLPLPPFVVTTGQGDEATAIAALRLGATDYAVKREGYLDRLVYTIEQAIAYDQLNRLNQQLQAELAERKRSETLLRESEQHFRTLANGGSTLIWTAGLDKLCNYFNEPWMRFTGRSLKQEIGNGWTEGVHPDDFAQCLETYVTSFDQRKPFSMDYRLRHAEGDYRWIRDDGNPRYDSNGDFLGYIGFCYDINEKKKATAELLQHRNHLEELVSIRTSELAQSRDAAEAANRAKTIFLATMSHEMRTPMNGVMGMVDLALRRATDPKQIDWLNKSKGSAKHLLDVIGDILDISHLEAEKMTLEEKNFSLTQVIEDALQMQGEAAQAKGLQLSTVISPALPDLLCGDPTRLRQILINFVGNAIKFSDHGQITVNARAVEEDKLGVLLRIEVTDQGIGISPEQQARLFHAFTQADGTMNRKYGGTGLGLSIAKRIALLMGGDAGVISEEGQGSTFWVTVRLKKGTDVVEPPSTVNVDAEAEIRRRYSGHRILVVDDEPINREVALIQLEFVDLAADAAEDGAEAVAMARKNNYAAIFMDMQMPKLNGVEATQQIRQLPGYRDIPIIAMTANAFAEDKAKCLAAGMTDFLIKPFNPDQLFAILLRALSRRSE